jgi:hypothetical protein
MKQFLAITAVFGVGPDLLLSVVILEQIVKLLLNQLTTLAKGEQGNKLLSPCLLFRIKEVCRRRRVMH